MSDFHDLIQLVGANAAQHTRLVAAYEGRSPLSYLSPEARAALGNRLQAINVNVPRLTVDVLGERLRVIGFDQPGIWEDWTFNHMQTMSATAHTEAMLLGECYAVVWAHPDGRPKISIESCTLMAADIDPVSHAVRGAVKRWEDRNGTHAVHYGPESITRYHSAATGAYGGFRAVEVLPNPLGVPPVVRLVNGDRLTSVGISEMTDVLSLTDLLVKLTTDLATASEYAARPRRWASGVELVEDAEGNVINPFPESARMMLAEDVETRFGSLPGSDLGGYENAITVVLKLISAVSGLPERLLGVGSDNPTSADSIRASEASLTAKAEARQRQFGRAWSEVAALVHAVRTGADPLSLDIRPVWADAATRSEAQEADAVVKLYASGLLPQSYALRKLGYSTDEIAEIQAARRADALATAGTDLTGLAL
ncbi:phage portal protein [Ammonicoccus fulvus]|uniref:Phage portal protein n=1 Tax=Ammonicoccus fulvus TaxID=3138240 RepID=A0ABZ3FQ34_9ACTN